MTTDMFWIICNACGTKFGKSKSGTFTETICPNCKARVEYSVEGNKITTVIRDKENITK